MSIPPSRVKDHSRIRAFYLGLVDDATSIEFAVAQVSECATPITIELTRSFDDALEYVWANGGRILNPEPVEEGNQYSVLVDDPEGNRLRLIARSE